MRTWRRIALFVVPMLGASIACATITGGNDLPHEQPNLTSTRAKLQSTPTPTDTPKPTESSIPTVTPTLELTATTSDDLGFSISSPVPLGNELKWFSLVLGVTDVIWSANDVVLAASPSNATPQPGSQYLLVSLSVECKVGEGDMCVFFSEDVYQVVDESGATYSKLSDLVGISNPFEPSDLEGGDTLEGHLAFMVPATADDLVLVYWRHLWGPTYFALE